MATSSPATSNNSSPTPPSLPAAALISSTNASKNLRGLNKPKCIKCGNVARSRCPYQSCKSCCAKAQNPCHIHVLKASATFLDKTPTSGSPLFDQQSNEASPSGNTHRLTSLRQLSHNFAQFNNLQSPLRSRKPLTRKEAAVINEWRFKKLKEYKDGIIQTENEAFVRYMQNIGLLEELLAVNPKPEVPTYHGSPILDSDPTSMEDGNKMVVSGMKLKLRSNPIRSENLRKRVQEIVDQGLRKLRKIDLDHGENDSNKEDDLVTKREKVKLGSAERASAMNDLLDRLNKARNEEDLKSCLEIKSQLFGRLRRRTETETEAIEISNVENAEIDSSHRVQSDYYPPKWFGSEIIDQDDLNRIDSRFSSLKEIVLL